MARRFLVGVAVLAGCLGAAGCGTERTLTGSGRVVTRTITVPEFSRIQAEGAFEVHVSVGAAGRVRLHVDDNLLPEVEVGVDGDTLRLRLKPGVSAHGATLRADVSAPAVEAIDERGASQVEGAVAIDDGKIDLSGASRARLSGSARTLELHASGASGLDSPELSVGSLDIHLSGASTAELSVTDSLSADLSGASSLRYRGSPRVTHSDVSGDSSITRR